MNEYPLFEPKSHRNDPITSHKAAEEFFTLGKNETHYLKILMALDAVSECLNAREIGSAIALTQVQVSRRTKELKDQGLIEIEKKDKFEYFRITEKGREYLTKLDNRHYVNIGDCWKGAY